MIHPAVIRKQRITIIVLVLLVLTTIITGMGMGYSSVSYDRIIPILSGQGTFKEDFVLFTIRLPRILITLLAGMALAVAGAVLQGVTRNELADPGIVGINAGAGVGVAIFFLYFPIEVGSFVYAIPIVAFISGCLTACLIYVFSYSRASGLQPVKFVLTGIGFSMALSGIMIILISSAEREKVDFIAKWLAGNIWGTDWPYIWAVLPWLVILLPVVFYKANRLNLLELSDSVSIGLGVSLEKERLTLILTAVGLASAAVSVTGGIAFVGLMAPHIAKRLVGSRHQLFLPVCLLIGAWLLLVADTIGRNVADPEGIAAGIVTALIGAPYFIYLLLKKA
ncbi:FecCD family ABC transporter permease [Sediminibacillus massiliensis]|uniref:FecCD family ABC transporter permease n=1 Tax=Sediminibacillus massiliensis TaxID=1926277 RepID=UPI000988950F|nr:iron ABC transporter permease [Sediminibacillus massiliensis]